MTLIFVLQNKRNVFFDSDKERMERLKTELVGDTDLGVSSLVNEDKSGRRDALNAVSPSAERELESLDPLYVNWTSEVPFFILSSDSETPEKTIPPEVDPGVVHLVTGPALTPLRLDSPLGLGAVCVGI